MTRSALMEAFTRQPTIRRENTSITHTTYTKKRRPDEEACIRAVIHSSRASTRALSKSR
jgi:hypothetical protein